MRRAVIVAVVALCLLASACRTTGGMARVAPELMAGTITVRLGGPQHELYPGRRKAASGICYMERSPISILVANDMPESRTRAVIAHELMHAIGFPRHIRGRECYFNPVGKWHTTPPCPAEVKAIKQVRRLYEVRCDDEGLWWDVAWACDMWNEAAERRVFYLVP
jgi:hypothetical protein